jgi:predicted N-acetyltransferase YhbS
MERPGRALFATAPENARSLGAALQLGLGDVGRYPRISTERRREG